ncbi:hypothetical protein ACJIZ3_022326 [Penstemon smallii]|uniref:Protein kinase domain-containing protein n=1 Tax=Penstemon smallii TaxID=265156 RepID=A0ABD3TLX1_9LAMI
MRMKFILSQILLYSTLYLLARCEPIEDKQALLDFIDNIYHSRNLNWDERNPVCSSWVGITCNYDNSRVIAVRLPAIGLKGSIPVNTLSRLSSLQILSLRSNGISGTFPLDLLMIPSLMNLYLQYNNFQGPLPLDFSGGRNISVLNLSNNSFNGSLPFSFSNLTHLTSLNLANNSLSGDIPDFNIPSLEFLDLSNNNLTGVLPQSLLRFPNSSFSGNNISSPSVPHPTTLPKEHSSKFSLSAILGIVIGSCVVAFVSIALLLVLTNRKKNDDDKSTTSIPQKKEKSKKRMVFEKDENSRLTFFEGCSLAFDLEDLLRASAEVLGKGTFGTTYKAAIEDATIVAVKRLKEVIVGRKEFEQVMEIVGSIRHENVAPLRSYYYSKDEKLVVYDFYNHGSVSTLLHAKRGDNRIPLDWETRLKIAIGAAKGIAHIHTRNNGKLVHGNIKTSNIFLNSKLNACMCDLGLATLTSPIAPPVMRTAGYRAPEITDTRKATQASDVYSFGVVLLELLTGKSPVHSSGGEEIIHLVRWVHSVVREEWTGEVFDAELMRYAGIEDEMVTMLQIGMSCVVRVPDERPRIVDVVKMVEDIRSVDLGNGLSSGTRSLGSTRTTTPNRTPISYVGEIGSSSV